jgi:hypothetical protein
MTYEFVSVSADLKRGRRRAEIHRLTLSSRSEHPLLSELTIVTIGLYGLLVYVFSACQPMACSRPIASLFDIICDVGEEFSSYSILSWSTSKHRVLCVIT